MKHEIILAIMASILLAAYALVIVKFFRCRLAYMRFKKLSNNMPMMDDRRSIGNHVISVPGKPHLCKQLVLAHEKLGKTIGWLYNDKFAATSVDLDLIKLFIQDEPNKHINRFKANFPFHEYENSIMLAQDNHWRKLRRYFAPAMKSNKFKAPNVISEIETSIKRLIDYIELKLDKRKAALGTKLKAESESKEFNIDDLVHKYTLDLTLRCFYKQYDLIDFNDDDCYWTKMVDEGFAAVQTNLILRFSMIFPFFSPVVDWFIWKFHPQGVWRQSIMRFVKTTTKLAIDAREQAQELANNNKRADEQQTKLDNFVLKDGTVFRRNMIDNVIDHFLDGKLTKDELFDTSCFLVAAADKTTADAIVHLIYMLGIHQDIQEKLRRSIQADGTESQYLVWCIYESLRLFPPGPTGCSRTVTREIKLADGKVLPANTLVLTPPFVIHRLKEYWGDDAEEFRPERWQDTSHFHPMQYIPFGAGPRACPGREFVLFEMRNLFTALMTRYKFECNLKEDMYMFEAPFLIFIIPSSHTYVTIRRLSRSEQIGMQTSTNNV